MNPFPDTAPTDDPEDWRNKPKSAPRAITIEQRAELDSIVYQAQGLWAKLRALEGWAYEITQEVDKTGYTSDLVLQSDVDVERVLQELGITVEEKPNHG